MTIHEECINLIHEAESYGWKLETGRTAESYVSNWEETARMTPGFDLVGFFKNMVENVKRWH